MFSSRTTWSLIANRLSAQVEDCRRRGQSFLDLTESNPTRCGFSYDRQSILSALADPRSLTYSPDPRGLLSARQAVADYYAERGDKVDPDQILLTTSTSEAYSYVFRLLADSGENILVPRPSYPLFDFLARLDDLELVHYPLEYDDKWRMDLDAVREGLGPRTRAVLVVNPNNPTGSFVGEDELRFLADCAKRHRLALIADEVFVDYGFAPEGPEAPENACSKRLTSHEASSEVLTFTLSGLSKISGLPQMKLAWVVVKGPDGQLKEALARLEVIADTYLSVSTPLQHALPGLLETRHTLQPQIRERVQRNLHWLDAHLAPSSPVSRLKTQGGWYVILKLPSTRSDEDWALELLREDGVLVHPGHFYDFPSDAHLALSLLPEPKIFAEGVGRILARAATSDER